MPDILSITFESSNEYNYLTYVDPSGILRITYDRDIYETKEEIKGYLDYSLNDFNIVSEEKLSDRTFEFIFDVSGEIYGEIDNSDPGNKFTTKFISRLIKINDFDGNNLDYIDLRDYENCSTGDLS